jgi:arginine/lysine/ornithine decarboxylase
MNELTIVHLQSKLQEASMLQTKSNDFSDFFRTFCDATFPSEEPIDWPLIRIVPVTSAEALAQVMFVDGDSANGQLTDDAKNCMMFLLDDCFESETGARVFLHQLCAEGIFLNRWLNTYFHVQPKVVLMTTQEAKFQPPSKRWTFKPQELFENMALHEQRILHLFRSLWEPRFWHQLRNYVIKEAGSSWHTPGHNSGHAFTNSLFLQGFRCEFGSMSFRCDLSSSVHCLGDLSKPESHTPLADAQRLTAEIFGAAQSCYITNGSSAANKAMLMTLLRPGECVLLDRNCHKSVHHAVVMAGAIPLYLPACFNARLGVWGPISMQDISQAVNAEYPEEKKPRMVILTTCTYEGILYPVWEIARLCERNGMLFYADEAWAPYLSFHPYYTWVTADGQRVRYNAIHETSSAHFAVHSTHKTMAAFSQASMIHVSFRFKQLFETESADWQWLRARFAINGHGSYSKFSHDLHEVLRYWHSTSPHYPMMATLDCAGVQMRLEGMRLIEERLRWIKRFKERVTHDCGLPESECFVGLREVVGEDQADQYERSGYLHDPLKLTISFRSAEGCSAFKELLRKLRIQWEKSTPVTILFLVSMGTLETHFEYLYRAIVQMKEAIGRPEKDAFETSVVDAVKGQTVVIPRDAALCDGELIKLHETEGRISSQFLVPYPPGIPLFLPGLKITRSMIEIVRLVAEKEGADSVHGLFERNGEYYVEVIRADELCKLTFLA